MFKKVLTTTVLGVSALSAIAANASAPGIYVTGQVGYANNKMEFKTNDIIPDNDISKSGVAGRVAIGYQFNQNFAVEAGYFRTAQKNATLVDINPWWHPDQVSVGKLKYDQNAIDLVVKGILPVNNSLNLYGKLGVAYLTTTARFNSSDEQFTPMLDNIAKRKFAPEAAIGVSYDITPNVSLDTSWTHIQTIGRNQPGNVDFIAAGIGYNFG